VNEAEREAFLEFASSRSPALLRMAGALTGDRHSAEDLVQAGLEKAVRRWHRIDDPEAYVRRVIYHEYVSWWRRAGRRSEKLTAEPPERAAPDHASGVAMRQEIQQALARLAPRQRAVIVLRYLEDRSEQDVARFLGCSVSTVSSQLNRALARLRILCPELDGRAPEFLTKSTEVQS
jgi:RNA polymerase sigma-70 factor (sigma-E family)